MCTFHVQIWWRGCLCITATRCFHKSNTHKFRMQINKFLDIASPAQKESSRNRLAEAAARGKSLCAHSSVACDKLSKMNKDRICSFMCTCIPQLIYLLSTSVDSRPEAIRRFAVAVAGDIECLDSDIIKHECCCIPTVMITKNKRSIVWVHEILEQFFGIK